MAPSTKDRILDAAQQLFAEHGFETTSIRQIVGAARVNLAAIHYHFKSKEALLDAVIGRRAGPINDQRLALLDRFEAEAAGAPVPVERILEAFLDPVIASSAEHPEVLKLIARVHAEGQMARLMRTQFAPVVARFLAAFRKTLPHVPPDELFWRIVFCIGAMVATFNGPDLPVLNGFASATRFEGASSRLIAFLAAGFRAPAAPRPEETR